MNKRILIRKDILYPDLSYRIIGVVFNVYNELGYGYQEKIYQRSIGEGLKTANISFEEQVPFNIKFKDNKIGSYFLDFLIEDKIILEVKKDDRFSKSNIEQLSAYLKASNLKLGILVNFTKRGLLFKRVVNINS